MPLNLLGREGMLAIDGDMHSKVSAAAAPFVMMNGRGCGEARDPAAANVVVVSPLRTRFVVVVDDMFRRLGRAGTSTRKDA